MTATAVSLDVRPEIDAEDPFALDVRVIEDALPAEQTACATNNGCAPTCASSCASTP
jgi:FxLD family lantipeptide